MGQTVNLLAYAFGGSNPSPPTQIEQRKHLRKKRSKCAGNLHKDFAEVAQLIEH